MGSAGERYPHQLGVQVIKNVDTKLAQILQIQENYCVWLDEILEQCKKSFSRAEPELLPKTPSAKRCRRRFRIEDSQDEQENEEPPRKRQSLAKKGRFRKKEPQETETEVEADDESDTVEPSPPRTTRRTRATSRTTAPGGSARSTRPTRSTRARKKPNNTENQKAQGPVVRLVTPEPDSKSPSPDAVGKVSTPLENRDLRNKLNQKHSVSSSLDRSVTTPLSPKTPRACPGSHLGSDVVRSGSPRPIPGFTSMSVRDRASKYEEIVLSSGGNTPTRKGSVSNITDSGKRPTGKDGRGSVLRTPSNSKGNTPATPSTITVKSKASISLSGKTYHSGSLNRSAKQIRKNSTQPQPTTPVSRGRSSQSSRASMRRSLKLTASKSRRSSILRHARITTANQQPEKDNKFKSGTEQLSRMSGENKEGSTVDEIVANTSADNKPRSKLTLKKTKVLLAKTTRTLVAVKNTEESMEAEPSESADVNGVSKSTENRRQTVTIESASSIDVPMESDHSDSGNSDDTTGKSNQLVKTSVCDDSSEEKRASTGSRKSAGEVDKHGLVSSAKASTSESCTDEKLSDSNENSSRSTRLSNKDSESQRKLSKSGDSENKKTEGTRLQPKRTRAALKKASVSSCGSPPEAETRRPRASRGSRSKTRSSKASKSSVAETSDVADDLEEGNNEVFAVPEGPAPKTSRPLRKRLISGEDDASDAESKRPCLSEGKGVSECEGSSSEAESAKEESVHQPEQCSEDDRTTSDSDADIVDRSPSPRCPANKVVRPHPSSFLNGWTKDKKPLFNINATGIKSFLRSSPVKKPLSAKEQEELRRKELQEKQRKENERMQKRKQLLQQQAEEKKRQREEHWRKVQRIREQKIRKEKEDKDKLLEKMEHKNKIPEQVMEVKRKEKQEKKQIRQQKHTEAEERRLQEEAERLRKLKEKEEEERQHAELLQRKREFEEQERAKKIAEEKRKQEEHQREMERRQREEELKRQQLQQESEQQRLRQQAEREREQQRLRAERYEKERQELEAKRQKEKGVEDELKKLRELEKQRKMAERERKQEMRQVEEKYRQLMNQQKRMEECMSSTNPVNTNSLNSTLTLAQASVNLAKSPQSYEMTPPRKYKKRSEESYDISGLRSDESTDDEDAPKRKIPSWAQGPPLKVALVNQYYHPVKTDSLFGAILLPDLNEIFVKKKPRFNKRTSSANWNSPLLKSSSHRT